MTQQKIDNFLSYIAAVELNAAQLVDYTDQATYFKTSELHDRIKSMSVLLNDTFKEVAELRFKVLKDASKRLKLETRILLLKQELSKADSIKSLLK